MFFIFLVNFFLLKILVKKAWKITFWPKYQIFDQKMPKFSKIWNLSKIKEEKENKWKPFPRYMYLDRFGKFLVIFPKKYFFHPCFKKIGPNKQTKTKQNKTKQNKTKKKKKKKHHFGYSQKYIF